MSLTKFTHTRSYAQGYLRNQPGPAEVKISGLIPDSEYHFEVYQYASNLLNKNGKLTVLPGNIESAVAEQWKSDNPVSHVADYLSDSDGTVTFLFDKQRANQIKFSGVTILKKCVTGHLIEKGAVFQVRILPED